MLSSLSARLSAALALVFLLGCGSASSSLSGVYHQAGGAGIITLTFKSGKVTMTMMGESKQGTYEMKGNQVILHIQGEGDTQLTLNDDGTLDSGLGTFKKN
jgi:hypothetical protein